MAARTEGPHRGLLATDSPYGKLRFYFPRR